MAKERKTKREIAIERAKLYDFCMSESIKAQAEAEQVEPEAITKLNCKSETGGSIVIYRSDLHSQDQQRQLITYYRSKGYKDFKINGRKYRE